MRIKREFVFYVVFALCLALLLGACGEGQKPEIVTETARKPKLAEIYKESRSDAEYGQGGWFKFSVESESYETEYGYCDFRPDVGDGNSRVVLLSNPQSGGDFPMLRIILFTQIQDVQEFEGITLEDQTVKLKFEKKGKFIQGTAAVEISKADSEWMEGSLTGELDVDGESKQIEGTFKAKMNIPDEVIE